MDNYQDFSTGYTSDKHDSESKAKAPGRFKLVPFDEITIGSKSTYLVKGIIPRVGLTVVWGPPKCGKSFWVFDLTMHVALARDYRGRRVKGGPVVYLALEGAKGFEARAEAYRRYRLDGHDGDVSFYLVGASLDLVKEHPELIGCIEAQLHGEVPAAIVIDTLNRSLVGSESDDEDMGAYVKAADKIRDAFGCAVIVVHHCGIDATRPRGHTSLMGAADGQISVKKDAAGQIVAQVQWLKDGPEGEPMVSQLESVEVGTDEDGDPITTCLVTHLDGAQATQPRGRATQRQILAMEALRDAIAGHGEKLPEAFGLPSRLRGCLIDFWKAELYARSILERDAGNPREQFKRLREALMAHKLIGIRDKWVWTTEAEGAASKPPPAFMNLITGEILPPEDDR